MRAFTGQCIEEPALIACVEYPFMVEDNECLGGSHHGITFSIRFRTADMVKGFAMRSSIPAARAVCICSGLVLAVVPIMGKCFVKEPADCIRRISFVHVRPSMTGILHES